MWRLANPEDREHGAVAVIVAVLMVALLGFAAISVDVAKLYSERAQLQNGADAAALMVAQKCAKNDAVNCSASSPLAVELANKNATDGLSNVKSIVLDEPGRTVQVTAGAQETGTSTNRVSMFFAGVLGFPSAEVSAISSVSWGSPTKGRTPFPLAFSVCQVDKMVDGASQLLQNHSADANADCPLGPAGKTVPGGFAWIANDSQCGALIDLAVNQSYNNPGLSGPPNCDATLNQWATELSTGKTVTVLLPVYNDVNGTGTGASYDVSAFASFSVEGWAFSGADKLPMVYRNASSSDTSLHCTGNCRGIIGKFVNYVSLADGYELGPITPHGAAVVKLTS